MGELTFLSVTRPGKVVCVGLNYRGHVEETGRELPAYPTLFGKFADSLCGPYDDIPLPAASDKVDWEAELTVVIGREARGVDAGHALDHVAGYTVANDTSMRDWQNRTLQWLQGKNFEASTPVGPVLVTPDEVDHASDLRISCTVNDEVVQDSRTSDLIFPPDHLIAYISTFTTLRPGDLILTGTPAGVGHAADAAAVHRARRRGRRRGRGHRRVPEPLRQSRVLRGRHREVCEERATGGSVSHVRAPTPRDRQGMSGTPSTSGSQPNKRSQRTSPLLASRWPSPGSTTRSPWPAMARTTSLA